MAADKYSREVARTLWPYGFYKKFQDRGKFTTQEDPGLADGVFVTYGGQAAFIECKTGSKTAFAFSEWRERQREFAIACAWMDVPYWLFLVLGDAIKSNDNPRQAYLMSGDRVASLEALCADHYGRKSASQTILMIEAGLCQLSWAGASTWEIPATHPFQEILHARPYQRSRTPSTGRAPWSESSFIRQALATPVQALFSTTEHQATRRIR